MAKGLLDGGARPGDRIDFAIYQVRGRFLSGGRAKGYIFNMFDPWDPPELPNLSECGTYRRIKWTARRAR